MGGRGKHRDTFPYPLSPIPYPLYRPLHVCDVQPSVKFETYRPKSPRLNKSRSPMKLDARQLIRGNQSDHRAMPELFRPREQVGEQRPPNSAAAANPPPRKRNSPR